MTIVRAGWIALFLAVLPSAGSGPDAAPPAKTEVKNLMNAPLAEAFTPGREVLMDLVRIPPRMTLDRHWHPGEEFHYYLEGEVEIRIEGQPSIIGRPGMVGHVPFKTPHQAIAGPKGAKILVFRVHTKGEPWRYLAPEGAAHPETGGGG